MTDDRLADYLRHIRQAAEEACGFVEGLRKEHFLTDKRTQNAVLMCMMVIGEAATQVMDRYPEFADRNSDVPWRNMRGMRNRIAHGYFEVNLDVVWDTVKNALPGLLGRLPNLGDSADEGA
jgi:uncharacterized protein with HEPN domain